MRGFFEHEQIIAGAAGRFVERTAGHKNSVAQFFGFEASAVHAPESAVVGVDLFKICITQGRLPIGAAGDDELVQVLEAATGIAELDSEPIEQFRMARRQSHAAEVVGCLDNALPEVPKPDAVDDAAPSERVVGAGDPLGERGAAGGLGMIGGQVEFKFFLGKNRQRTGAHGIARLQDVAAMQHLDFARFAASGLEVALRFELRGGGINHLPGGNLFQIRLSLRKGGLQCMPFRFALGCLHFGEQRGALGLCGLQCGNSGGIAGDWKMPVGKVGARPSDGGLDGIERSDLGPLGQVFAFGVEHLQFGEGEDVIVFAFG